MPLPGKCWHHLIFNTRGTWLPGDPRGFHSRGHRLHSSGDYKHPPPADEHVGLYRYNQKQSEDAVYLPAAKLERIGEAILEKIRSQAHQVIVISVDRMHVHVLAELPDDRKQVKRIVGTWKQAASHLLRDELPGRIWSRSCDPIRVRDRRHQREVYGYIRKHARHGAWVWSFRDVEAEGGRA